MNWIQVNSKPCPKYKRPIEKNQRCMHMTCMPPCKFKFHEVTSKTLTVVDTCEKLDGTHSIVFVDKLVDVNDPYDFKLLVMGKRNHHILE